MDYIKVIISGNLVADAEVKQSDKGPFTTCRVACNLSKEETIYYSVALTGDKLAKHLIKGKKVVVEGVPHLNTKVNQYKVMEFYHSIKRANITLM